MVLYDELSPHQHRYDTYAKQLKSVHEPILPHFDTLFKELTNIESDPNTFKDATGHDFINMDKMVKLYNTIECILQFRRTPYHYKKEQTIFSYFSSNLTYFNEDEIYEKSVNLEQTKGKKGKKK